MGSTGLSVVMGAFGYTGIYIVRRLLSMGKRVKTITGHPNRPNRPKSFGPQLSVAPLDLDQPNQLIRSLEGAEVLYNTYWIRFAKGQTTFEGAVENTRTLIRAAQDAGVRRIVHVSITNASTDSLLPYFSGKRVLEKAIEGSGLSYAIIRPAVIFGREDILLTNIPHLRVGRVPYPAGLRGSHG